MASPQASLHRSNIYKGRVRIFLLHLKGTMTKNTTVLKWIYRIWESFTYGIHEFPRSGKLSQAKQDSPLHRARLLHQPVMKQHEGWKIVLSAENDSWDQWTAWPVMLSALCFLKGGNTQRLAPDKRKFSVDIRVWRLKLEVIDMGSVKDVGAVSSCKVADSAGQLSVKAGKNRSITLCSQSTVREWRRCPRATFSSSPSHFAQTLFLWELWLANVPLIGLESFPRVNSKSNSSCSNCRATL